MHMNSGAGPNNRGLSPCPPEAAKCFPETACADIPENFPHAETSKHAKRQLGRRAGQILARLRTSGRQVRNAIQA